MKKFTKNKKSREILHLHVEFLQSFLTARHEKDEVLMGFLENLAAEELRGLVELEPERTVSAKRATEVLARYGTQKRSKVAAEA